MMEIIILDSRLIADDSMRAITIDFVTYNFNFEVFFYNSFVKEYNFIL
jgi:hypothetical protein